MPSGSRKSHCKSRNGCSQCKKRRKKCDQRPPRCSNCERWGVVCDYTALSAAVEQVANRFFASSINSDMRLAYVSPLPAFDAQSMELLHHYATRASLTLSTENTLFIWQKNVPDEAKTHQFLMHSLLALSALHLSHVQAGKRNEYVRVANREHEQALTCFRSAVGTIDCTNGNAVFAFSFLTVVFSAAVPIVFGFSRTPNPTSAFIDILLVLRRAHSAVYPVLPGVRKGPLGLLVDGLPSSAKSCPMHTKGREVLEFLGQYNECSTENDKHKAIYRMALDELKRFLAVIQDAPPLWANSLSWPTAVSVEFFQLLQEKRPFALVLLSYWCIPLYRSPSLWFNAWAKNIVRDIWSSLEGASRSLVTWPAEQVGAIPRQFHTQPCLCLECHQCGDCAREMQFFSSPRQGNQQNPIVGPGYGMADPYDSSLPQPAIDGQAAMLLPLRPI